jgi:SsrA-binding protein
MKKQKQQGSVATPGSFLVATNPRASRDYDILKRIECGIALTGPEVKSLRAKRASIRDAYATVRNGELWLHGMHISPYEQAGGYGAFDPERDRKLLAHRYEIDELLGKSSERSLTLVPTKLYFRAGKAKVELALARGRRLWDKRAALIRADQEREAARARRLAGARLRIK